jgi:hypothetical protein
VVEKEEQNGDISCRISFPASTNFQCFCCSLNLRMPQWKGGDGAWGSAIMWMPAHVPAAGDEAIMAGGGLVMMPAVNSTVKELWFSSYNLFLTFAADVRNVYLEVGVNAPAVTASTVVTTASTMTTGPASTTTMTGPMTTATTTTATTTITFASTSTSTRTISTSSSSVNVVVSTSTSGSLPGTTQPSSINADSSKSGPLLLVGVLAGVGGALIVGAVIGVVSCWMRRRRGNATKTKLMAPSAALLTGNPTGTRMEPVYDEPDTFPEYECSDPSLFEMTNVRQDTSTSGRAATKRSRASVPGASADTYTGLTGDRKTYTQTSNLLLPGQVFAAAAAAAAATYEDPEPTRRWTQRQRPRSSTASLPDRGSQPHIYHLAGDSQPHTYHMAGDSQPHIYHMAAAGDSGDYVDVTSDEQTV